MNHLKRILFIFTFLFSALSFTTAQNAERIISGSYSTILHDLKPMGDGRWVVAVQELSVPGALGEEIYSLAILDNLGILQKSISVPIHYSNELGSVGPVWVLSDGNFLVSHQTGNCDAGFHQYHISKLDTHGIEKWYLPYDWYEGFSDIKVAPDGNILARKGEFLVKLALDSGEEMWRHDLSLGYRTSYSMVPGTEDYITVDTSGLIKYFKQQTVLPNVSYMVTNTKEIELGTGQFSFLNSYVNGQFFGLNSSTQELYRFDTSLQTTLMTTVPQASHTTITDQYIFSLIGYPWVDRELRILDWNGSLVSSYKPTKSNGFRISQMATQSNSLAVIGEYVSGPYETPYGTWYGRSQGWFRSFPVPDFSNAQQQYSLSITDIVEHEPIQVDSFYEQGPDYAGYVFNISGGKYLLEVTNTGSENVESFAANITFEEITNYWFCPPTSAMNIDVQDVGLASGESMWIEFADLVAYKQKQVPVDLCFWTSDINHRPDDIPEDDRYCFARITSDEFLSATAFSIFPNPADQILHITHSEEIQQTDWSLIDIYGRVVIKDKIESGANELSISTNELLAGIYFLKIGNLTERVVVQH